MAVNIVCFLLLIVIIEEAAEFLYKRTEMYKKTLGGAEKFLGYIPDGLEILNNGSGPSHYGINYKYTELKGFNFGTAPQSIKDGFNLLKRYRQKVRLHAIIIIIIMCPLSFGNSLYEKLLSRTAKFYGILPHREIEGWTFFRALKVSHPLLMKVLRKIKRLFIKPSDVKKTEAKTDEPPLVSGWRKQFALENLTDASQADTSQNGAHRKAFAEQVNILAEEIEYCKAHSWRPVLVVPPVPASTRKWISPEFAEAFTFGNIRKVQERFPDVRLLSYYDDERFMDDMFNHGIFVNEKGQEFFSKTLFHDVGEIFGD